MLDSRLNNGWGEWERPRARLHWTTMLGAGVIAAAGIALARAEGSRRREDAALQPWDDLDRSAGTIRVVHAATLASNAHNTQPWRFEVDSDTITVHADLDRNIGDFDPFRREMHLSLGCAIENLVLAAEADEFAAAVETPAGRLPPSAADAPAARIRLTPAARGSTSAYATIPLRATNRGAYRDRPLPASAIEEVRSIASQSPSTRVRLFFGRDKDELGERIVEATRRILADAGMARDNARWYRFQPDQVLRHRDRLTLDANVVAPLANIAARVFPPSSAKADRQWLIDTAKVHVGTAPLLGLIAVEDLYDRPTAIAAGRLWQRLHLSLTAQGLAAQPLNQPVELVDRERQRELPPEMARSLERFTGDGRWRPTFLFRAGYAKHPARHSPRRPVASTLLA